MKSTKLLAFRKTTSLFSKLNRVMFLVTICFLVEIIQVLIAGNFSLHHLTDIRMSNSQMVTVIVTLLCTGSAIIVGTNNVRKLKHSIENLTLATRIISTGNLSYQARIIEKDEVGWLTFAFNQMVNKLARGRDRLNYLQKVTAVLSGTAEPDQIAKLVLKECLSVLEATSGTVVLLTSNGLEVEKIAHLGDPVKSQEVPNKFPVSHNILITEAILRQKPIWIENVDEYFYHWPQLKIDERTMTHSCAALPLVVNGKPVGGIQIFWAADRKFNTEDKEFILAIARQSALALNRAQLYKDAQKAIQVRDDFLSIASHELRTPLTPLKLQIQNLLRIINQGKITQMEPEKLSAMVSSADAQINRITKLIEELLDVTRITSGKIHLDKEPVDLAVMIKTVVERYKAELASVNCEVSLHLEPNLIASLDSFRMEQVITNLITNAMRYGAGKPISISTAQREAVLEIRVKDHGMGIDPKDQDRIFEQFERASPTSNYGGLGLGLFIAMQIVKQHQGNIQVESVPSEGATFIITLPETALAANTQELGAFI